MAARNMWVRQEYKPNKCKFEQPFELEITLVNSSGTKEGDEMKLTRKSRIKKLKLVQNYSALGSTVWDGSIVLAKMFDNRRLFSETYLRSCRVVELGAGCGLVGLYICLLGAKHTTLTDQTCCISLLEENVRFNIPKSDQARIRVKEYSWGDRVDNLTESGLFQLILAAEVLYSAEDSLLLAKSIPYLADEEARVFVSMGRNRGGEQSFVDVMKRQGWTIREVCYEVVLIAISAGICPIVKKRVKFPYWGVY